MVRDFKNNYKFRNFKFLWIIIYKFLILRYLGCLVTMGQSKKWHRIIEIWNSGHCYYLVENLKFGTLLLFCGKVEIWDTVIVLWKSWNSGHCYSLLLAKVEIWDTVILWYRLLKIGNWKIHIFNYLIILDDIILT